MNVLRKKIEELEYQNRILNQNYKSSTQEEKQKLLEKIALSEVRANEAISQLNEKDNEILILKKDLASLNLQLKNANSEKRKLSLEMSAQLENSRLEFSRINNEGQLKQELNQAKNTIHKLEDVIKTLERDFSLKAKEAQTMENNLRQQAEKLRVKDDRQELIQQKMEYEKIISEKEELRLLQKNEWSEVIYLIIIDI